jgi:hypothetical protein
MGNIIPVTAINQLAPVSTKGTRPTSRYAMMMQTLKKIKTF